MGLLPPRFRGGTAVSAFGRAAGRPSRMDVALHRSLAASVDLRGLSAPGIDVRFEQTHSNARARAVTSSRQIRAKRRR
jgi:hypothetical protein